MIEFVQSNPPSRQHHGQGIALTQEEIVPIAFYEGQGNPIPDIALLVSRGKTGVDDILMRDEDIFEPALRFAKPATVSHSPFITPEPWFLHHYLLYTVALDPTVSVRQIGEKLNQRRFPFRGRRRKSTMKW
jgi:hypothetical protein